ncbi:hypothetical protein ACJX0J_034581, partial [Zea mays]
VPSIYIVLDDEQKLIWNIYNHLWKKKMTDVGSSPNLSLPSFHNIFSVGFVLDLAPRNMDAFKQRAEACLSILFYEFRFQLIWF